MWENLKNIIPPTATVATWAIFQWIGWNVATRIVEFNQYHLERQMTVWEIAPLVAVASTAPIMAAGFVFLMSELAINND